MFSSQSSQVASSGSANYIEDVFSTYLYTGNGSSQVIDNGINLGSSNSGGSVYFDGNGDYLTVGSPIDLDVNNYTIEFWFAGSIFELTWGTPGGYAPIAINASGAVYFANPSNTSWQANVQNVIIQDGTWNHYAIVRQSGATKIFRNGVLIGTPSAPSSSTPNGNVTIGLYNSGARGFISNFRAVVGTAVYTSNFTPPTSPLTAVSGTSLLVCQEPTPLLDKSTNAFSVTVNGDSSAKGFGPFTSATAGKGGLVWIKGRNNGWNNILQDTNRGINSSLCTNNTDGAIDPAGVYLTSFNSNGFSIGTNGSVNFNTNTYVSWAFRKQPKFFDVVTYTGDGSVPRNIAHNLGSTPGCIIVKSTSSNTNWAVYHRSLGATQLIRLNRDWAAESSYQSWANTSPTPTQFTIGSDGSVNASGQTYVAYLFAHDAGGFGLLGTDNVISCGTFNTDGSGNATVNLGYEPQWILAKQANGTNSWGIYDTMRSWSHGEQRYLLPDMSITEGVINATNFVPTATGFTTSSPYATSAPYIYIAIRKGPMRVPTDATTVFKPVYATTPSSPYTMTTNFPVDLNISAITNGTYNRAVVDRLRGMNSASQNRYIVTNSDSAESSSLAGYYLSFQSNTSITDTQFWTGYSLNPVYWNFRRAPRFFDQVCYTGTGTALTLNHNLGVAPELIITKSRSQGSGYNWNTWCTGLTNNQFLNLNTNSAVQTYSGIFGGSSTVATATTFNVSNSPTANNDSGQAFVAYLFATCPGVSKVGTFTANATSQNIDCGFTNGARFVMYKQLDGNNNWVILDTARGYFGSNDPYLSLNNNLAEDNSLNIFNTFSGGFQLNGGIWINGTFIFLAIA